jgi:putative membrane protein
MAGAPSDKEAGRDVDLRVVQANERTLLAWVRTSIGLMAFGFVVARFGMLLAELGAAPAAPRHESRASVWLGGGLVLLGSVSLVLASARFVKIRNAVLAGRPVTSGGVEALALTGLLAAIGVVLSIYLVVR